MISHIDLRHSKHSHYSKPIQVIWTELSICFTEIETTYTGWMGVKIFRPMGRRGITKIQKNIQILQLKFMGIFFTNYNFKLNKSLFKMYGRFDE